MDISEKAFQNYIQAYLQKTHAYRVRSADKRKSNVVDYDLKHHVDPDLLLEFITATQPEEWERLKVGQYIPSGGEYKPRKITVIARGSNFYCFANDVFLTQFEDDRLLSGKVGVMIGLVNVALFFSRKYFTPEGDPLA